MGHATVTESCRGVFMPFHCANSMKDFGGKKDIFKSKWEVKASENTAYLSVFSRDGNTGLTQGVTINLNSKSHEQAQAYLLKEHLKAKVQQG
jgi:hypothetical protein